ncbi:MAG: halocyanin domain-containing protein [Haloferacaceae archaeon]
MRESPTRRQALRRTALVGLAATAGCLSAGGSGAPTTNGTTDPTATGTATDTPESTPPASLDDWLADANGYRGEPHRVGVGAQPTVAVGHPTDDGIAFDPPVIEVAPMTNVTWDWAGHGGQHNVVALDGTFDSGRTNAQPGTSYHYIFEETGEYPYVSEPHREEGMKGAVVVREPPSTGNEAVDEWVGQSSNFDGTFADRTGADTATVTVGAPGNGGHFAFDPPALKVSAGTTVVWEWTGDGGAHNVAFQGLDVASGAVTHEAGATFEHTFDEPGTYLYTCEPHHALGERGAVVVE